MRAWSRASFTALAASLLFALPAAAQFGPPSLENVPVMDELVARAFGGPAWWKVSDADTTVYILASPGGIPKDMEFNQTLLDRRLTGANQVLLPPRFDVGPMLVTTIPGLLGLMSEMENKAGKNTMEPSLPPATRARFVAARERAQKPATRYGALQPGVAGLLLAGDVMDIERKGRPDVEAPQNSDRTLDSIVEAAARRKRVRATPAARFGGQAVAQLIGDMRRLPLPSCMTAALDVIESGALKSLPAAAPDRSIVQAWAEGDVRPLLEAQKRRGSGIVALTADFTEGASFNMQVSAGACADSIPTIRRIGDRWVSSQSEAIAQALQRKGHAVAVVEASSLLMQNGVLDRLRRQGFTVTPPAGAE